MLNFLKMLLGVLFIFWVANSYADEQSELFQRYIKGDKTALAELLSRAEKNEVKAQLWLGNAYYGDKNYEKAIVWYEKAAEAGDRGAQNNLGERYKDGEGVAKDYEKSFYWLSKAAGQNIPRAQNLLGDSYYDGLGVKKNREEAVNWYRKAAEQGDWKGQLNLGEVFRLGEGVSKDYQEALKWLQKAAEQGSTAAMGQMGYIYQHGGFGVIQDFSKAITLYETAAQKGEAFSMNQLGWLYENGVGKKRSITEALKWYRKGAENNGNKAAKENLARLEQQYRAAFNKASSLTEIEQFISAYEGIDIDNLIPQARNKLAESRLQEYRNAFKEAFYASEFEQFITTYQGKDPDKLIPKARQLMAAAIKRDKADSERLRKENEYQRAHACDHLYSGKAVTFVAESDRNEGFITGVGGGVASAKVNSGTYGYNVGKIIERPCSSF